MVFSSVPVYLDQPVNWHQLQQSNHHEQGSVIQNSQQLEMPTPQVGGGGGGSMIRPGSMVDRARIAKIPQPEAGLNCPRCDSTNTKFCYFNNYSLTQPRYFCKTCRRYWTRGGALRSVPVGGGCRRNKRSKNSSGSSKSQVITANMGHQTGPNKSTSGSPSSCSTDMSGHFTQLSSQLPFMASIQNLSQYNGGPIGTNIAGFQAQMAAVGGSSGLDHTPTNMGFQIGSSNNSLLPFLAGLDTPTNLFPYQNQNPAGISNEEGQVKMEDNRGLNLSRQFMGISENNQYWRGYTNAWTDQYSGVNSTSATNLL